MDKEKKKEYLAHQRNIQTHLWTAMLVTISGTLSLLQHINIINIVLLCFGVLIFGAALTVYLNKNESIEKLIRLMED
jgi:diacylglycerol kinase